MPDTRYPRAIHVGMGILQVVHNAEQEYKARTDSLLAFAVGIGIVAAVMLGGLFCFVLVKLLV